jgi:hypothetical protein
VEVAGGSSIATRTASNRRICLAFAAFIHFFTKSNNQETYKVREQAQMLRRPCAIFHSGATRKYFSTTLVFRIAPNPDRMSPETARKVKDEDKADLERERKLREQFATKIQGTFGQQQQQQNTSSGEQQQQPPFTPPFAMPSPGSTQWKFMRLLFFGMSIYLIVTISNLRNPDSPLMMMQGQPWWQVPADVLVTHTLIRFIVSFRQQRQIKSEYETACKQNPSLSLSQFMNRAFPTVLAGHRTTQPEIIAALMAAYSVTRDLTFVDTVTKAVAPHSRDSKAAIDNIMECLKTDFPQIFVPMVPNPNWQPHPQEGALVPPPQQAMQQSAPSAHYGLPPPPQQYYAPPPGDQPSTNQQGGTPVVFHMGENTTFTTAPATFSDK